MTVSAPGPGGAPDVIDIQDPDLLIDPYRGYSRIRESGPLLRAVRPGIEAWLVTRYADVKMVLSDPRFVMDPGNVPGMRVENLNAPLLKAQGLPSEYMKYWVAGLQEFDGAEHLRLRKLVSQAFTVRKVFDLRPRVVEIVDGLLDGLPQHAEDGVVDLLRHFAHEVSGTVLCELVGIPEEDRDRWKGWRRAISSQEGLSKAEVWREVIDYIRLELIERRRAEPADDVVTALVQAHDEDDDRLTDTELTAMIFALALTVQQGAHLIGNGTLALLTHPDQLALLRSRPDLVPNTVHELLRFCGPTIVPGRLRYATEDVEVGGELVRKGEAVWVGLASANWDPRRFPNGDQLDITRTDQRREAHLAFGAGPHYCLGAALARQEAEVVFGRLPYRFPNLALAVAPEELVREQVHGHFRLTSLPVRL